MSVYDIDIKGLDGGPDLLSGLKGKAALFVNVASKCGLTPQYTALESLEAYLILSQQEVLVDVYTRAESWRRERCEGQEGEVRIAALGLSLPLREVYADVLADLGD